MVGIQLPRPVVPIQNPTSPIHFLDPTHRSREGESRGLSTLSAPPSFVALIVEPMMIVDPGALVVPLEQQDMTRRGNLVQMHLWGVLQDEAPHQ